MSMNICPRCGGKCEYLDVKEPPVLHYLCTGCEIKIYYPLHHLMNEKGISKEEAYKILLQKGVNFNDSNRRQMGLRTDC